MPRPPADPQAFARNAEEYYEQHLRASLEPDHKGDYLVLDVESGDYEVDADETAAIDRARAKHPDRVFYILRIGHPAAVFIGAKAIEAPA